MDRSRRYHGIGNLELRWEADTNGVNTSDANLQNNIATVDLFVGRVPTPVVANSTGMTNENIVLDATASYDEEPR